MRDEQPLRPSGAPGPGETVPETENEPTLVRTVIRDVIDLTARMAPAPAPSPESTASPAPVPAPPPLPVQPGQVLVERYTVLQLLGRGSMGVVVSAYDARLDRCVALKLLRRETDAAQSRADLEARMVREAQAMARLSHPNVVAVYDVGTLEDGAIFIAMERVDGVTLRRWLEQAPRTWREVLAVYLGAGRGLAAAHEAGLVHRDFKPENVLVGQDGRARVTDFGLARAESSPTPESTSEATGALALPPGALDSPLTMQGMLMGTPRYMAPEQLRAKVADARSDVFAFCVALHEALHGRHPFAGATSAESLQNQREGRLQHSREEHFLPPWVTRPLMQGLRADPAERPESMGALVSLLERDPALRRRMQKRMMFAVAVLSVLSTLVAWKIVSRGDVIGPCAHLERQLDGTWDRTVRGRVQRAFLDTHQANASEGFTHVAQTLDGYAARWVKLRRDVCLASPAREQPAPAWVTRGVECLERKRDQLRVLTELLTRVDAEHLAGAASAQSLPPLEPCTDIKALSAMVPLPEDPAVRARVEGLRARLDRMEALRRAGQYTEALESSDAWLEQVQQVGDLALHAQALHELAQGKEALGRYAEAEALARRAIALAAKSGNLVLVAQAWTVLVRQVGWRQGRYPEAMGLMLALESAVDCADDDFTRAEALNVQAITYQRMGRYDDALAGHERALALRQKTRGPEDALVAASYNNLGTVLSALGRFEEARAAYEHALRLRRKSQGQAHPLVALSYSNLGTALLELGRYDEARDMFEHALAIRKKVLGPEHPDVALSLTNLGMALSELGRHEEALTLQRDALALRQKLLGPEHPNLATPLTNLAGALRGLHRYQEALPLLDKALALSEKALGPEHPDVALALTELGQGLEDLGRHAEARARYQRALALQEKALRPGHPDIARSLAGLGRVLEAQGRGSEARSAYERALALREVSLGAGHPLVARTLADLGGLLVRLGRLDEARAPLERAWAQADPSRRDAVHELLERARGETRLAMPVP